MDFWQYKTYLHGRMPRVKCDLCGKTRTVIISWARPGSGEFFITMWIKR